MLLVDNGDFFNYATPKMKIYSETTLQVMGMLNYDVINIADKDFCFGAAYLQDELSKATIPYINANIIDAINGNTFAEPYAIRDVGGVKIGFLGLVYEGYFNIERNPAYADNPTNKTKGNNTKYKADNNIEVAKRFIPELQEKCDIIIVLGHMEFNFASQLAKEVPGIDFIIAGHNGARYTDGIDVQGTDTTILQAGNKGQYVGRLDITLDDSGEHITKHTNELVKLTEKIPNDDDILKIVTESEKKAKSGRSSKKYYATSETCAKCHQEEYAIWQTTAHSKTFSNLNSEEERTNRRCLVCHTTAYGYPGGYTSSKQTPELQNVQCESCHSAGQMHADTKKPGYGKISIPYICLKCHNSERSVNFNYEEYWQMIRH